MPTVAVRDETKEKLDRIADRKRWTLAETVDALCDEHEEREGKPADDAPAPEPQPAKSDATPDK